MQLIGNHAAFAVDNPQAILDCIPDARHTVFKGRNIVAVPYTLDHMQILRNLGLAAPAPIGHYPFPGRFKPYAHQRETMRFMVENFRAYILNGLGTGKTAATAWAADYLMSEGVVRRALICAPLSCLERVWGDALYQMFPHRKFVVLHGSREARLELLKREWDFAIVNHHGIGIINGHLPADVDLIIIDELAVFRNTKAKTLWGEAKKLITPDRRAWGLTGTPTPNAPTDAYALSKLLTPERYNGSFTRFKLDTMMQVTQFKWVPRKNAETLVNQLLQPSIRYALEDCIDLPPTIYQTREVEMSPEQQRHYMKLQRECATEIQGVQVTAVNAAVLMSKLLQASLGVVYGQGETAELDFGPRLAAIEEVIEEAGGKCIIFVPLTGALYALYNKLKKKYACAVVEGSTPASKRNQIFSAFTNSDTPYLLLANPATMSHGLSLHQKCATTIWAAPCTSHEVYCQANARTVRPGQKLVTNIVHIAASPVERKVYKVLQEKGAFQEVVLDLFKK